jgi:nucleoside-diphosphate-sugar epimerase
VSTRAGSRVLVTGASGLIGRNVLELVGAGADTHAVSRHPQPARAGVTWWQADLAQPGVTTRLMHEIAPEIVIHLAGEVRGERSLEAVAPTLSANLVASVELLEAAARLGCRRVVLSGSLLEEPVGTAQATPPSPYGASRWASSAYARMFHALFATPIVILRPSFAYGPGQEVTKLVPHVITTLLAGGSPALSSGDRLLDLVFARDVAEAYLAAAVASDVEGSTIDIGVGHLTSVRDVVATIVELVGTTAGAPEFGRVAVRPLEQQIEVDPEAAAAALGWRAQTPLVEGLRRTITWYRESLSQAAPDVTAR